MKRFVFLISLLILLSAASAVGQSASSPLDITLDEETLSIANPSDHCYDVDLFFFFWDGTKDKHTIKAKDVSIPARDVEKIAIRRLGKEFAVEREEPRPEIIAFSLADEKGDYSVCYFRRTENGRYRMDDDITGQLTELARTIPGYRDGDKWLMRR
jgi:hypothetical protein